MPGTSPRHLIDAALSKPRIVMSAYACDPDGTMEERNGWQRAVDAADKYDVTVLCGPHCNVESMNNLSSTMGADDRLRFIRVGRQSSAINWHFSRLCFYLIYNLWHRQALKVAQEIHSKNPFHMAHMVTVCGFREPGYLIKLDIPFIWGPIGGTQTLPLKYYSQLDFSNRAIEMLRSAINHFQLHYCPRIRATARKSFAVISATQQIRDDLRRGLGVESVVELETGISHEIDPPRALKSTDQPLRILWAGRIRAWKALPLLIHALQQLPPDLRVIVRVVGDGKCRKSCQKLADQLGVGDRVEWESRPRKFCDSLEHYRWADVFAFTSLRDTSGSGLLESLAAGVPIIGLDHQGARDIMTDQCAIRIPLETPSATIIRFAAAITELACNPQRLRQLSHGATKRAEEFHWTKRSKLIHAIYDKVCAQTSASVKDSRYFGDESNDIDSDLIHSEAPQGRVTDVAVAGA